MSAPTQQQIMLVQSSFAKVAPIGETAAQLFYARLFDIAPDVKPFFKSDMTGQGRKLMTTLTLVVASLRDLDSIMPAVQALAVKHVAYGVVPAHYDKVGEALLWTLEKGLGDDFSEEIRQAWRITYGTLSSAMITTAYPERKAA
jgi:hemoglobin-like flavoprotein